MSYAITDNRAWAPLEIMVSAATIVKASAEIDADLGAVYARARSSTRRGTPKSSKRTSTAAGWR